MLLFSDLFLLVCLLYCYSGLIELLRLYISITLGYSMYNCMLLLLIALIGLFWLLWLFLLIRSFVALLLLFYISVLIELC